MSESKDSLLTVWKKRHDYHHLNPGIERDRHALEELAREKVGLLAKVESEVFAVEVVQGKLKPANPKYWDVKDNKAQVFLRLEP